MNRFRDDAGRRLLPHVIDELGQSEPDRIIYEVPNNNDLSLPFTKVSARGYANAINRASWWFHETLGVRDGFPTVGYIGPQDVRYFILLIAAIKTGYKMLYTSPRNTKEGDIAVITAAYCNIWLVPSRGSNVQKLLDHVPLQTVPLPDLDFFFDGEPVPHYAYQKTWENGKRDPAWVLHTSGSTGNPKPIVRYLDSVAAVGANNLLPKVDGRPLLLHDYYDARVYLTFPLYHAAGLTNGLVWPLFHGTTVILGPERPVSVPLLKEMIQITRPSAVFTAPSLVEEISKDDEFLKILESINALAYGGGPVSIEAGNKIWEHTKLRLSIGTTETGWFPCIETDPEDWNYIHLHPKCGFQLHDRGGGLYELVMVKEIALDQWQPIFSTFPDLEQYNFKDLFSKHPKKPNLYKYEGRADNILVLSNGEKVQPNNLELIINTHQLVRGAVISGQGRFQIAAIIEVVDSALPRGDVERESLLSSIWPVIQAANRSAPSHAILHRDFVIIASPDKPFPRTSKSTVLRGAVIRLYQKELEQLYLQADSKTTSPRDLKLDWST